MNKKQTTIINKYIKTFPKDVQVILEKMYHVIKKSAPESIETFSYGIPTFDLNGKHLVHFAGYKKHIGFYPTPSGIEAFKKELSAYKSSKGSVQFPLDKSIPYDLIKKIVEFRLGEVE